jgi:hypothetical protein
LIVGKIVEALYSTKCRNPLLRVGGRGGNLCRRGRG